MKSYEEIAKEIVYRIGNIANRPDLREVQEKQVKDIVEALETAQMIGDSRETDLIEEATKRLGW